MFVYVKLSSHSENNPVILCAVAGHCIEQAASKSVYFMASYSLCDSPHNL